MKKAVHVTPRDDGSWAVIREGNTRASSIHETQKSAVASAKELVRGGDDVELLVEGQARMVSSSSSSLKVPEADPKKAFAIALGERVTSARKMRGHSLRSLADQLQDISHTSLQKYEKGLASLDTNTLSVLSDALDVRMSYFLKKPRYQYAQVEWRKSSKVGVKVQRQLEFEALDYFQRYLEIETLLSKKPDPIPQKDLSHLSSEELPEAIESLAEELRKVWGLGSNPLPNVHSMLEEVGVKVRILPGSKGFDGLASFLAGGKEMIPVVALSDEYWKNGKDLPRFRLTALHELGHLVMKLPKGLEHKVKEGFCHRFASAFLFPREKFHHALGDKLSKLPITDAKLLKPIWGISIAAILRRAKDLEIITAGAYKAFCIWNNSSKGFGKEEPQSWAGSEDSQRFKRLILHAFSEGIISSSKAADLLDVSLDQISKEMEPSL